MVIVKQFLMIFGLQNFGCYFVKFFFFSAASELYESPFPGMSLFSLHEIAKVLSLQTANQKRRPRKEK